MADGYGNVHAAQQDHQVIRPDDGWHDASIPTVYHIVDNADIRRIDITPYYQKDLYVRMKRVVENSVRTLHHSVHTISIPKSGML